MSLDFIWEGVMSDDLESGELPVEQSPLLPARDRKGIIYRFSWICK
jgi:hypothetical protein